MIRYYELPWKWTPLTIEDSKTREKVHTRLSGLLQLWEGTPYRSGSKSLVDGVDCVRWVTAILDEISHRAYRDISTLPLDVCFHNKKKAIKSMLEIKRLYPHCRVLKDRNLQPGDILVVGPPGGGPGHVMLVGTQKNTLWHCTPNSGVVWTGWSLVAGQQKIFRVYRIKDREISWI